MRVFVTGTGRCGTTTFARAMQHATNYTAAHEGRTRYHGPADLEFPDDHVESNPRLGLLLGPLVARYPSALYVHLCRPKKDVVDSWVRRGPRWGPGLWAPFSAGVKATPANLRGLAELC